jgi:hypothetical protein
MPDVGWETVVVAVVINVIANVLTKRLKLT